MIFAWLGLWRLALKIPKKVLQGMMAAVGLSVVISQFPMMLGHHPIHAMMGLGTLCVIILYEQYATYLNRMVPSSLFALVLAGLITGSFNLPLTRAETPTSIAQALQDIGLAQQFQHWWPHLQNHTLEILTFIFMIACISSIQSLLAGIGLNTIQPHESARLKRDLTAIGLANMISGYLGGLPVAGVILRGQANRAAGAVSNLSAFLSGVWTLSAILLLGPVLKNIPLASLAAIFILIGYKMLRLKDTVSFYRNGTLWVHWSTAFIGWRVGLLWGIACGFLIDWLLTRLQQKSNTEVLETSPP
jgi:MFS superfamily sulfate permease-like transporter